VWALIQAEKIDPAVLSREGDRKSILPRVVGARETDGNEYCFPAASGQDTANNPI